LNLTTKGKSFFYGILECSENQR